MKIKINALLKENSKLFQQHKRLRKNDDLEKKIGVNFICKNDDLKKKIGWENKILWKD